MSEKSGPNETGQEAEDLRRNHDSEVTPQKAKRRRFSAGEKRRIVALVDSMGHGEQGGVLRREGVYSSQLAVWRKQLKAGVHDTKRGKKKQESDALASDNKRLRRKNEALELKLKKFELIVEMQKKMSAFLMSPVTDGELEGMNS